MNNIRQKLSNKGKENAVIKNKLIRMNNSQIMSERNSLTFLLCLLVFLLIIFLMFPIHVGNTHHMQ